MSVNTLQLCLAAVFLVPSSATQQNWVKKKKYFRAFQSFSAFQTSNSDGMNAFIDFYEKFRRYLEAERVFSRIINSNIQKSPKPKIRDELFYDFESLGETT